MRPGNRECQLSPCVKCGISVRCAWLRGPAKSRCCADGRWIGAKAGSGGSDSGRQPAEGHQTGGQPEDITARCGAALRRAGKPVQNASLKPAMGSFRANAGTRTGSPGWTMQGGKSKRSGLITTQYDRATAWGMKRQRGSGRTSSAGRGLLHPAAFSSCASCPPQSCHRPARVTLSRRVLRLRFAIQ